jgi:hypothetical protein
MFGSGGGERMGRPKQGHLTAWPDQLDTPDAQRESRPAGARGRPAPARPRQTSTQLLSVEVETSLSGSRTHARTSVGGARRSGVMRIRCRGLEGGAARLGYQTLGAGRLSEQQVPRHPCAVLVSEADDPPRSNPPRVRGGTPSGPEVSLLGGERDPRETGRQGRTVIRREGSRWAPTVPCLRGRSARGLTAQARWKPLHGARPLQVEGSPPHLGSDGGAAQLLREAGRRRRMPAGSTGRVPRAPPSAAPSMTLRRSGRCR